MTSAVAFAIQVKFTCIEELRRSYKNQATDTWGK